MVTWVAVLVVTASLALAALAGLATARGRRIDVPQLVAAGVCEVTALIQAAVGVVNLVRVEVGSAAPGSPAATVSPVVFGGYLLCLVLVPPLGVVWAVGERSRWGTGVLALAGLVNAVLIARLQQVWRDGA